MVVCSPEIQKYFDELERKTKEAHSYANEARKQGRDPEPHVDIPLAASVPEKVEALMAAVAPQIRGSGVAKRIQELEAQYGSGDWRVALIVAREIAEQKFCKFDQLIEGISIGIRTGLAYITQGTVSAPLEGIVDVKLKKRRDGKDYLAVYYAGPIRGAGGTSQSVSVVIADYVRKSLGIGEFDPDENEINRFYTEVIDYYDRVERKQYRPSKEEMDFLIKNIRVQIDGDQTSEIEVSNFKHLDRVETDKIRGGVALVFLDGITLKANKLWRQLAKWGKDFGLEDWCWLDDFLKLKEKLHAALGGGVKEDVKIKPDFYFLSEVVAGRPVFSYPLAKGGFRLRYGKTRMTGYGSWSIAPTTMLALNQYLAVGSQLRVERPGKSTALTVCDYIDGPIVKLKDGSVVKLETEEQTKKLVKDITEILFLGDILISHGDFVEQGHKLMPAAYVPEFWIQEVKKACEDHKVLLSDVVGTELAEQLLRSPIKTKISLEQAKSVSEKLGVPLHPDWTFFWNELSIEQFSKFNLWLKSASSESEPDPEIKRRLELIGCPHEAKDKKVKIDQKLFEAMKLASINEIDPEAKQPIDAINRVSSIKFRCKSGYTIGARMGRPEKAKMRTMKSTPHGLFPVGKEGDRLRSINAALEHGKVTAEFSIYYCELCKAETIYPRCPECDSITRQLRHCPVCRKKTEDLECHRKTITYEKIPLEINKYFNYANKLAKLRQIPPVIKGIRGTSNKDHIPENLIKPLLRAKYNLYVNKDGTIRYDGSELGMTHFKPREIGTSIEKIKELGYSKDVYGRPLESEDQMIEIFPQDVVLPACDEGDQIGSDEIFFRVANFVDELLVKFYKMKPFYSLKSKKDLIGHLIIGLAPHTSAGIMSRIIGFSQTSAIFAHPYWHAACRRDLDGEELAVILAMDAFLNFSRQYLPDSRGSRSVTADTMIFVEENSEFKAVKIGDYIDKLMLEKGHSIETDDFEILKNNADIKAVSFDSEGKAKLCNISKFIRHVNDKKVYEIKTSNGKIKTTEDHSLFTVREGIVSEIKASDLKKGDEIVTLSKLNIPKRKLVDINILELLNDEAYIVPETYNLSRIIPTPQLIKKYGNNFYRYKNGMRAAPVAFYNDANIVPSCRIRLKADSKSIPHKIKLDESFFKLLGFIYAEGHIKKSGEIEVGSTSEAIINEISGCYRELFNENPHIGIDPRKNKYTNGAYYRLNLPAIFGKVLFKLGIWAQKSYEKEVPDLVFRTSTEKIRAFIAGHLLGDGTVYKDKTRNFTRHYTNSEKLAAGLSLLPYLIGMKSSVYKQKEGKYRPMYEICISDYKQRHPYWPLRHLTKNLYQELRRSYSKIEVSKILSNIRKNTRLKSASKHKILEIISKISDGELKLRLSSILDSDLRVERIVDVREIDYNNYVYDLEVPEHQNFLCGPHPIFAHNSMDAPLVASIILNPKEVDDEVYDVDAVWEYPLDFYLATLEFKPANTVKIEQVRDRVGSPKQYEGIGYTHWVSNMNAGVRVSAYKSLPTMLEKMAGQIDLAKKIRAVSFSGVSELIVDKHFLRDIKGNLRKFTTQSFRCVACNTIHRRMPMAGVCMACKGKLVYTIAEGTIKKYLQPSLDLAANGSVPEYMTQTLQILKKRIDSIFGEEKTKQVGLGTFF